MRALFHHHPKVILNALGDFDRCLDSVFGESFLKAPAFRGHLHQPAVNIRETENTYVVDAELPGREAKDIEIRLNGNNLTIASKHSEEKNCDSDSGQGDNYLICERRCHSFSRSFQLPESADSEGISASFRNGVLSIQIRKKTEAQQKLIQISAD